MLVGYLMHWKGIHVVWNNPKLQGPCFLLQTWRHFVWWINANFLLPSLSLQTFVIIAIYHSWNLKSNLIMRHERKWKQEMYRNLMIHEQTSCEVWRLFIINNFKWESILISLRIKNNWLKSETEDTNAEVELDKPNSACIKFIHLLAKTKRQKLKWKTYSSTNWLKSFWRFPRYSPIFCLLKPVLLSRNLATSWGEFSMNLFSIKNLIPFSGFLLKWREVKERKYTTINTKRVCMQPKFTVQFFFQIS